jgi:DNA repair protein RecO (recombination protein O)
MTATRATALVVRGTDWSETSRITTLFTREFGKVRALAKGGRRLRSNFEIAFDLLTVCEVVFFHKVPGGLDLLTEARVIERFAHLRTNLTALYAGYYAAELLADGTQDYDPHPQLFDAAVTFLRRLGSVDSAGGPTADIGDVSASLSAFELVWLRELGYSPRLDACAACGAESAPPGLTARVAFSPSAGGVICPACTAAASDRRFLTASAWSALRGLVTAGPDATPDMPAAGHVEVRQVLGQAVSYVLGRRPKLLGYLDRFGGSNGGLPSP